MDFISLIKEKASEYARSAVKSSGNIAQTVKSNFTIADKEQEIKSAFVKLGEMVYDAYKTGTEVDTEKANEMFAQLDNYYSEIEDVKEKLNEIKNVKICAGCGERVKAEHAYCPKCGSSMTETAVETE